MAVKGYAADESGDWLRKKGLAKGETEAEMSGRTEGAAEIGLALGAAERALPFAPPLVEPTGPAVTFLALPCNAKRQ